MDGRTDDEHITDVETGDHGLPAAWTWRGSRCAGGEHHATMTWRLVGVLGGSPV
jgi:hypothetical protein